MPHHFLGLHHLSLLRWPPFHANRLQYITLLTSVFTLAYIFLGDYLPRRHRRRIKDSVPGLENRYGNDCFVNCIVQVCVGVEWE
jgi:ubiquitin C-terminal hydrolase